jgi:hypothetical protein
MADTDKSEQDPAADSAGQYLPLGNFRRVYGDASPSVALTADTERAAEVLRPQRLRSLAEQGDLTG